MESSQSRVFCCSAFSARPLCGSKMPFPLS
jgi:hypothetical protein